MIEKLLMTIPEAISAVGVSRSFLYERLADGSIESRKAGRKRLIVAASLAAWAAALPESELRQASKGAR